MIIDHMTTVTFAFELLFDHYIIRRQAGFKEAPRGSAAQTIRVRIDLMTT